MRDQRLVELAKDQGTPGDSVNVLADDQSNLCQVFARPSLDRFAEVQWTRSRHGLPVLGNVLAFVECDLTTVATSGDHDVVIGQVKDLEICRQSRPLVFFRSGWGWGLKKA